MSDFAISAENLGKMYRIGQEQAVSHGAFNRARRALTSPFDWLRSQLRVPEEGEMLWAVRNVSFDIPRGQAIGLIGRNGAGKSTLLKLLARITEPTEGFADINGHVASLLEVGTGMHPELTGRENIYLNGCILGMNKGEITRNFDAIVEFSGISKFLDTQVKRYSSGMRVRLGFAIASHLQPEIMLIDEVLAVGDAEFQRRCLGKMKDVTGSGRTIVFVSHNMGAIRSLTSRCIYMSDGGILDYGESDAIVDRYLQDSIDKTASGDRTVALEQYRRVRKGDSEVSFQDIHVGGNGEVMPSVSIGAPVSLTCSIESKESFGDVAMNIVLKRETGETVVFLSSRDTQDRVDLSPGRNECTCTLHGLRLLPGKYFADFVINRQIGSNAWDVIRDYPVFEILNTGEKAFTVKPDRPGMIYWSECDWRCR